jgi:hypothetical protein
MHDRSNGRVVVSPRWHLPKYKDYYAFHVMLDDEESKNQFECYVNQYSPWARRKSRRVDGIHRAPVLWRYFVKARGSQKTASAPKRTTSSGRSHVN